MIHQISYSVYQDLSGLGADPSDALRSTGCDSIEMLTSFDPPDPALRAVTGSVHLPYAVDWLAAWEGRPVEMTPDSSLYYMFGRSRDEVVSNIRRAIASASVLHPPYGVFHACNADTDELIHRRYTRPDSHVVEALCDMLNEAVSGMPGGEPPFRILLENLWWPGLRLLDDSGFRILQRRLEFDRWGINLDTGHMMCCLPVSSEGEAIDALMRIFDRYPDDLIDRIDAVHLHWSATWPYRSSFEERDRTEPFDDYLKGAYAHVGMMDTHIPFTDPRCTELIGMLDPAYVTHEILGDAPAMLVNASAQRSLFG